MAKPDTHERKRWPRSWLGDGSTVNGSGKIVKWAKATPGA